VRKLHLVIDNNPSPMGAVFSYTPDSGRAEIETRVRVEEYTTVRAVAEFNDGRLVMVSRFLKASGGCSHPPERTWPRPWPGSAACACAWKARWWPASRRWRS
jgi:hypothetical protein